MIRTAISTDTAPPAVGPYSQTIVAIATADRAWQRIDREIMQRVPWIPLGNPLGTDLVSERIGNYLRTPALGVLLDQLWIEN